MKGSALFKLIAITAVLALIVFFMNRSGTVEESALSNQVLLVPELKAKLNDVTEIKLKGAENATIIALKRTAEGWVASSLANYPADLARIREYLLKLSESQLREPKTASPAKYAKLGLEDLAAKDAKGIELELTGLGKPVRVLFGSIAASGGQGAYVRKGDDKQSYLASGQIRPEASINSWIVADIAAIPSNRIKEVEITPPAGSSLKVSKQKAEDSDWEVQNVPKGKTLSAPSVGNALAGALDGLRLESVAPAKDSPPELSSLHKARYLTFEGMVVELQGWEIAGKAYGIVSASQDAQQMEANVLLEASKAQALNEAIAKADAPSKTDPAAGPVLAAPAAPPAFDEAKFRSDKLTALTKEIEAFNKRTRGWVYVLPAYKYANVKKTMADMLATADAPTLPPTQPGNPLNLPLGN